MAKRSLHDVVTVDYNCDGTANLIYMGLVYYNCTVRAGSDGKIEEINFDYDNWGIVEDYPGARL